MKTTFTNDDIFYMADTITAGKTRYTENIFDILKENTGRSKAALRRIFKTRLSQNEIVDLMKIPSPDTGIFDRCQEIRRLTLNQINCNLCYEILFKSLKYD